MYFFLTQKWRCFSTHVLIQIPQLLLYLLCLIILNRHSYKSGTYFSVYATLPRTEGNDSLKLVIKASAPDVKQKEKTHPTP